MQTADRSAVSAISLVQRTDGNILINMCRGVYSNDFTFKRK